MKKQPDNPNLKLKHYRPLFSNCKTPKDFREDYQWAYHTETCFCDDLDEYIKDFMAESNHFITPEVRRLQRIRNKINKNINRINIAKEKFLQGDTK